MTSNFRRYIGLGMGQCKRPPTTKASNQFNEIDNNYIYAALLVSVDCVPAEIIVQHHAKTHDGVMTWIHLHDSYNNTGNLQMKIT